MQGDIRELGRIIVGLRAVGPGVLHNRCDVGPFGWQQRCVSPRRGKARSSKAGVRRVFEAAACRKGSG